MLDTATIETSDNESYDEMSMLLTNTCGAALPWHHFRVRCNPPRKDTASAFVIRSCTGNAGISSSTYEDHRNFLRQEQTRLLAILNTKFEEDLAEVREHGELEPSPAAREIADRLMKCIVGEILFHPKIKCGVFIEDDGGIDLAVQSLATDRRFDFRISPEGDFSRSIQIDEHMKARSTEIQANDLTAVRELTRWILRRD